MLFDADIIREYNHEVVGFSVKTGRQTSANSHFNRAVTGAIAQWVCLKHNYIIINTLMWWTCTQGHASWSNWSCGENTKFWGISKIKMCYDCTFCVAMLQKVDFFNDWKMVTMWIGGNNLCSYCKNKVNTLCTGLLWWLKFCNISQTGKALTWQLH